MTAPHEEAASSSLWLELFFDLVVVAAMVVLATALEEHPSWQGIGVLTVTFTAIWMCWASLAVYVNLADERVERRTIIAGMAAIALMAASLLHLDDHANVFAVAFLACRALTIIGVRRSGRVTAAWPLLVGSANLPWIASLWVPGAWKYVLWALGLVIDLVTLGRPREADEAVRRMNERAARGGRTPQSTGFVVTSLREHHLTERLGTFVIIVLGESVLQLVRAAAETEWTRGMWVATVASFVVIVGIWRQTFAYGFTAAPGAAHAEERLPAAMLGHLVTTGSLVVMAAGLGEMVRHADHHPSTAWSWITAGALAVYLIDSLASGALARTENRWVTQRAVPAVLATPALAATGHLLPGWAFTLLLLLPVSWLAADARAPRRR